MDNQDKNRTSKIEHLKILYIAPRFFPYKAGAEGNLLAMAERMVESGHDVTVYTSDFKFRDEKLSDFEDYKGIKIYRLKSFIQNPYYLWFAPALLPKILQANFDLIHVTGFGFIWEEFCLVFKKLIKKDTILINTPHGPFMAQGDKKGVRGFARKTYTKVLSKILPKLYTKVIAVVPRQKEWLKDLYSFKDEQIVTVLNGIDKELIEKKVPEYAKDEKVIITYLNRMEWYKGIQDVVMALAKLNRQEQYRKSRGTKDYKQLPDFEFWIMGRPAKFTETLKRLVAENKLEDRVKFIYSPSDEERDEAYLKSQINILPSKWEAFGIVLLEAMAKGNAIVTTNQNQAVDILIKEGESGYAYDFADVDRLSEILRTLLEDYDLRQKIIKHNLEFVKGFTWDAVFPEYEKLTKQLVEEKREEIKKKLEVRNQKSEE